MNENKETYECSISECKKRKKEAKNMSLKELELYNTKCGACGNWIFKDNKDVNDTYNEVSVQWAEKFMKNMMNK